jgi:hypothetical protein
MEAAMKFRKMLIARDRHTRKQLSEILRIVLSITGHGWIGGLVSAFVKLEVVTIFILSILVVVWPAGVATLWSRVLNSANSPLCKHSLSSSWQR